MSTASNIPKSKNSLFVTVNEFIGGAVSAIGLGTSVVQGAKFVKKRKDEQRKKDNDEKEHRDKLDAYIESLPPVIQTLTMAAAQNEKIAATLNTVCDTVTRLENNQAAAKQMLQIQSDHAGIASYTCNSEGRCIEVSQPMCDLFDMPEKEMLANNGAGWLAAVENSVDTWKNWIDSIKDNRPYEARYVIVHHSTKPPIRQDAITRAWPIRNANGDIHGYYGVVYKNGEQPW